MTITCVDAIHSVLHLLLLAPGRIPSLAQGALRRAAHRVVVRKRSAHAAPAIHLYCVVLTLEVEHT